jgi:hypothetical protein
LKESSHLQHTLLYSCFINLNQFASWFTYVDSLISLLADKMLTDYVCVVLLCVSVYGNRNKDDHVENDVRISQTNMDMTHILCLNFHLIIVKRIFCLYSFQENNLFLTPNKGFVSLSEN